MVDNKAKIILTINSIITSIFFGLHFINYGTSQITMVLGTKTLVISGLSSMVFILFFGLIATIAHILYNNAN